MVVWENQNLQELWGDENRKIEIKNGKLLFFYNPKLCFFKIEQLISEPRKMIENFDFAAVSFYLAANCSLKYTKIISNNNQI